MLELQEQLFIDPFNEVFVCSDVTLYELERMKNIGAPNEKEKAKKLIHLLEDKNDFYKVFAWDSSFDLRRNAYSSDLKTCQCAYHYIQSVPEEKVIFRTAKLTNLDYAKKIYKLNTEFVRYAKPIYKGYQIISGNTNYINERMSSEANENYYNWNVNEYLVIENTDLNQTQEMRFDGMKFVPLKLPSSKFIKGKNSLQRCALDLLNNQSIPIVSILGNYGSGKSYLSLRMALYHVKEKGNQSKILGVREPNGEGKDIGWLKGTFEEKTDRFFLPLEQQLDGGLFELDSLKQRGVIETNIPYYMKGTTYNDTIMIVDEAEDLTEKQIKLIGTRLGNNSRIFLSGDYKQSLVNASHENALIKMNEELRGNPLFGCIYLGEDVRSTASKVFSELFLK